MPVSTISRHRMDRLQALKDLLTENPQDSFARYGLALEYVKQGKLQEAIAEFQTLLSFNPEYGAAYFHMGQTMEKLSRTEEARAIYRQGIEVATRQRNSHARSELESALSFLD